MSNEIELTEENNQFIYDKISEFAQYFEEVLVPIFIKFTEQVFGSFSHLTKALISFHEVSVRYCAIHYYDIPESDIKRIEGSTVVMKNHRRVDIDLSRMEK